MPLLIAILAGIFIFCAIAAVLMSLRSEELATHARIGRLSKRTARQQEDIARARPVRAKRFKVGDKTAAQLESAGILLKAEEFIIAWAAAALVPAGLVLLFNGSVVTALGLALVGGAVPPMLVSFARKRRLKLFEKQLGDALGIISNCLRAGLTFQQAMESIASEMADPIGGEFTKTLREMRFGVPMETAMENIVRRMNNNDLGMLVSAVLIQRQVGGNLADIIDSISVTIRDRLKIKGDIKVMSASGRISGMVIGLLPVVMLLLLMIINPTYFQVFFENPIGIILLVVAGLLELTGFLIVQKVVDIKF